MIKRLIAVVLFALAFGFVEAAVVIYLRELINFNILSFDARHPILLDLKFIAFLAPSNPLLKESKIIITEMFRESSTIIMLASLAYLAAEKLKQKLGAFLISFAIWDLSYYFYLYLIIGWPENLFSQDIFFLLPIPWVGPVITAIIISSFLLLTGLVLFAKRV